MCVYARVMMMMLSTSSFFTSAFMSRRTSVQHRILHCALFVIKMMMMLRGFQNS